MATHSSILAWRIHGQRSLVCYTPGSRKESDTTEQLRTYEHAQEGALTCLQLSLLSPPPPTQPTGF